MRHLLRVTRKRIGLHAITARVGPIIGVGVLLAGGIGAFMLSGAGIAEAAVCPGTGVVAGTSCTITGTVTLTAGTLTLASPTALTWTGTRTGLDQSLVDANPAHQTYTVDDATGNGLGWNVTVSATTFTSTTPAATLPNTGTFSTNGSITNVAATAAPSATCTTGATCTLPTDTTTYPVAITTAATTPTAYKIYDTAVNTGLGSIAIGLPGVNPVGWWVAVPANAVTATYTSTITLEVLSAP
jgi:hypothetical protein